MISCLPRRYKLKLFIEKHRYVLVGGLLTAAYFYILLVWHSPPPPYCSTIEFVRQAPSNEVGDFFAGLFAPVAFLWLVLGYFMQANELRLQRKELALQRKELEATRGTMESQVSLIAKQTEIEQARVLPYFSLSTEGQSQGKMKFSLSNTAAPAYNCRVRSGDVIQLAMDYVGQHHVFHLSEEVDPEADFRWFVEFDDSLGLPWQQEIGFNYKTGVWSTIPVQAPD